MSQVQEFPAGTTLVTESSISRRMYIIQKGRVRVYKTYSGQRITLATLGEGEIFGELSFFDAAPRSASVETLTDVTAIVLDAETASQQMKELPSWVVPILRAVFARLRESDHKVTVLQSMNEIQKKHYKKDTVAEGLYAELLRYVRGLRMMYDRDTKEKKVIRKELMIADMDQMLGQRYVGLSVFFQLLEEHCFVEYPGGLLKLNDAALKHWETYLAAEIESGRFLVLTNTALAILRRIVTVLHAEDAKAKGAKIVTISLDDINIESLSLYKEGLAELNLQISSDRTLAVDTEKVFRIFTFQSILKCLDPSVSA